MDLSTQEDKILLKNCILVKLKLLNYEKLEKESSLLNTANIENEISLYENIFQLLKSDDTEGLIDTLNHYKNIDSISQFSSNVLSNKSAQDFANEYLDLTKKLMMEYGKDGYSDKVFEDFKKAFYKGTNIAYTSEKTTNMANLEEEPSFDSMKLSITPEENEVLNTLSSLIKQANNINLTASEFKQIASKFRDLTKKLGIQKFQHFFSQDKKSIVDMNISFDTSSYAKPVYLTDFALLDENGTLSHKKIHEPASNSGYNSTYYQNLCYSYLEADAFSKIDENLMDSDIIASKILTFSDCYKNLEEMMLKCNFQINGEKVFVNAESFYSPTNELVIPEEKVMDDDDYLMP